MDKKEREWRENNSVNSGNYGLHVTAEGRETTEKEINREDTAYDFDDYTSIDSRKQSFMTKSSESTDFDDNATYDSIMRLRSD